MRRRNLERLILDLEKTSVEGFSRKAHVSRNTLARFIDGRSVTTRTLERIHAACGLIYDEILEVER